MYAALHASELGLLTFSYRKVGSSFSSTIPVHQLIRSPSDRQTDPRAIRWRTGRSNPGLLPSVEI